MHFGEPLPRPSPETGHLEHGVETEDPPGTNNPLEGRGRDESSSSRALVSTFAGESLPRPFTESEDSEHGVETKVSPPYERVVDNIPGTSVGLRTPVSSEPPPVQLGSRLSGKPTQLMGNSSAVLVEDGDFNRGSMWLDATPTKDSTADKGKMTVVHDGGQGTDVVATVGTTTHAYDAGLRQMPVSSLPSNDRLSRRSSAGGVDVVEAVVEAAHCLASNSAIPGVCEAARLISILVKLVTDYRDCTSEVEWRVKRCRSIIFTLERAGEVLGKVRWLTIPAQ